MPTRTRTARVDARCDGFARAAVQSALDAMPATKGTRITSALPSLTNFVYLAGGGGNGEYVAKFGLMGRSRPSAVRLAANMSWLDVEQQHRSYTRSRTRLHHEFEHMTWLAQHMPGFSPRPIGLHEGVLVMEYLPNRQPLDSAIAKGDIEILRSTVPRACRMVEALHCGRGTGRARAKSAGVDARQLGSLIIGTFLDPSKAAHGNLAPDLAQARRILSPHARRIDRLASNALTFGDFKPEHVLFGSADLLDVVLIDPSLHVGRACEDYARFVARAAIGALQLDSSTRLAVGDVILEALARSRAATQLASGEFAVLIAADVFNVLNKCTHLEALDDTFLPMTMRVGRRCRGGVAVLLDRLLRSITSSPGRDIDAESMAALLFAP